MVGFDNGTETQCVLDAKPVSKIHANLSAAADTTTASRLEANLNLSFMGDTKGGAFDIRRTGGPGDTSRSESATAGRTPTWLGPDNGLDVTRRPRRCGSSTLG